MNTRRTEVLPALSDTFTVKVKQLAAEASDLSKSYADLTERMLKFAERFHKLWEEAQRLDGGKDNGQHAAYCQRVLGTFVNNQNSSIWSRWNTIGAQAGSLMTHKSFLPPYRDSLYELAVATKAGKKVDKWIQNGKLTSACSVRDVKALCDKGKRSSAKRQVPKNLAAVTMYFKDYELAAKTLHNLLLNNDNFTVHSEEAFRQAVKEILGSEYEQVESRLK